jgi:two-component system, chemotaxis family, chemotaxis protein CheY
MPSNVLLLDDSPTVRSVLKIYLRTRNFHFFEAEDGADGLAILRREGVNLVVADVNLPGMDGLEFLRQLRGDADSTVAGLPVLVLSGDQNPAMRARGLAAGASEFLTKPVQSGTLLAAIGRLLPESA